MKDLEDRLTNAYKKADRAEKKAQEKRMNDHIDKLFLDLKKKDPETFEMLCKGLQTSR